MRSTRWRLIHLQILFHKRLQQLLVLEVTHQEITMTSGFIKDSKQKFTPFFGFAKNTQHEQTGMSFCFSEKTQHTMEVNDYHLIFDLNGVLVVTGEDQFKSHLVVLKPSLKEFIFACVKKFMVHILSLSMKRNFLRHLDIIAKKTCVLLSISKILDQTLYFKNDDFLLERPNKLIFHKNLKDFFRPFPSMTFENTLLVDDTLHKNMFNPLYSAIFFKTFYESSTNGNYFPGTILPYLEPLHSSRM